MVWFLLVTALLGVSADTNATVNSGSMNGFYTYSEVIAWTSKLASNSSSYLSTGSVGKSSAGKDIPYVKLSSSTKYTKFDVLITAETTTNPVHVNSVMYQVNNKLNSYDLDFDLATRNYW